MRRPSRRIPQPVDRFPEIFQKLGLYETRDADGRTFAQLLLDDQIDRAITAIETLVQQASDRVIVIRECANLLSALGNYAIAPGMEETEVLNAARAVENEVGRLQTENADLITQNRALRNPGAEVPQQ